MNKRKYTTLSLSDKEKMFREYKTGLFTKIELSKKYGVSESVLYRLVKKYESNQSFDNFTGRCAVKPGRPQVNFENKDDELEFRRMAMAIEGKLRTLKKLKSQTNSD